LLETAEYGSIIKTSNFVLRRTSVQNLLLDGLLLITDDYSVVIFSIACLTAKLARFIFSLPDI